MYINQSINNTSASTLTPMSLSELFQDINQGRQVRTEHADGGVDGRDDVAGVLLERGGGIHFFGQALVSRGEGEERVGLWRDFKDSKAHIHVFEWAGDGRVNKKRMDEYAHIVEWTDDAGGVNSKWIE